MSKGYYDTLTSAYVIWAFSAYAKTVGPLEPGNLAIKEINKAGEKKALTYKKGLFPTTKFSDGTIKIQFDSDSPNPIFYQVTEAGFERQLPAKSMKNKLEIQIILRLL